MLNYSLFNKYILRTPSLSLSFYNTLIKKSNIDFFQIKKNKSIMLSLFIASKTVHDKIVNHERLTTKELLNLELTTFKYLIRSSTRSTPFGLFSKISIQPFLGKKVLRREGKVTTEDGTLAGSDLDMATAVRNAVSLIGRTPAEALQMASLRPAEFLGLEHQFGRIKPGYRASLVALNEDFLVKATWIDGRKVWG